MIKELYGFAVHKCNISPSYFLNEMGSEELEAIYEAYTDEHKEGWEKTRAMIHAVVASQSSKPITAHEIMPFSWDEDVVEKNKTTKEDFQRIKDSFSKNKQKKTTS